MDLTAYNLIKHEQMGVGYMRLNRAVIRVRGRDRATFLNGQLSNDIVSLKSGERAPACLLNSTGHLEAYVNVMVFEDEILLETDPLCADVLVDILERYHVREKVEISDVSRLFEMLTFQGNSAGVLAEALFVRELPNGVDFISSNTQPIPTVRFNFPRGETVIVYQTKRTSAPHHIDILAPPNYLGVIDANASAWEGVGKLDEVTYDVCRVEAGTPIWGKELHERVIPLEANLHAAIHQNKGCYTGQEIIARILSRGHTNRTLVGLRLENRIAERQDILAESGEDKNKVIGKVTSYAESPDYGHIALGYVRNEYCEIGTVLCVDVVKATVSALPFGD